MIHFKVTGYCDVCGATEHVAKAGALTETDLAAARAALLRAHRHPEAEEATP